MSENKQMMLIEAMKRLRVIEKRIAANNLDITRYSSMVSTERPQFSSEEVQRKKVKSLVQANTDLVDEYLRLKKCIEYTNLVTEAEIDGKKYRLSDLLVVKRKMARLMMQTYQSLNTNDADSRMSRVRSPEGQTPTVVRLYSEEMRTQGLRLWQDLYDNIDSRLEVINATTPLLTEIPS